MPKPISILTVFVVSLALVGCGSPSATTTTEDPMPDTATAATSGATTPAATVPETPPVIPPTPIKDAVEKALLAGEGRTFPKGTRLVGVDLNDGTVTLDLSKEFNQLGDMGDSVESEAQKVLREALATVPTVEKMRVSVEGKPYESQMTDWNTPFSVRDTSEGSGIPNGSGVK